MIKTARIKFSTKGNCDIIDISGEIRQELAKTKFINGVVIIFCVGSTAGITTCEYEPGLVNDLKETFQNLVPQNKSYKHNFAWGDGNAHSHLRASLVGASLSIPFVNAELISGSWQQVIFIDFDTRPRKREVILQFIGE